jgi:hypothetical protein
MRRYGLPLLILLLLCGNLVRIQVNLVAFKNTAIVPAEIALGAIGLLLLARKLRQKRLFLYNASLIVPMLLFVLAAGISLGVNTHYYRLHSYEVLISATYLLRWAFYCLPYVFVVELVRTQKDVKELLWSVSIGVFLFSVFGIFQAFLMPDFAFMLNPTARVGLDWDVQHDRLVSTLLDPNFAGCLIAMGLAGSVAFLQEGYRKAWLLIPVFGLALLLTYSRGSILSFLIAFVYLIVTGRGKKRLLAAALALGLIPLVLAPYLLPRAVQYARLGFSDYSARGRIYSWKLCLDLIRDNPVFGIGFNTTPYVVPRLPYDWGLGGYMPIGAPSFEVTGGLLTIFVLSGLIGTACYCFLLGKVLWMGHAVYTRSPDRLYRSFAQSVSASTIIWVVSSFFTLTILYVFLMGLMWIVFGLLNVCYTEVRKGTTMPAATTASALTPGRRFSVAVRGLSVPAR